MEAAAEPDAPVHIRSALMYAQGCARRFQLDLDCTLDKLNLQLDARRIPTDERVRLKSALATCHAID